MQIEQAKITEETLEKLGLKDGRVSNQFSKDEIKMLIESLPKKERKKAMIAVAFLEHMIHMEGHSFMLAVKLTAANVHIGARPTSANALHEFAKSIMEAAKNSKTVKAGGQSSPTTEEAKQ